MMDERKHGNTPLLSMIFRQPQERFRHEVHTSMVSHAKKNLVRNILKAYPLCAMVQLKNWQGVRSKLMRFLLGQTDPDDLP